MSRRKANKASTSSTPTSKPKEQMELLTIPGELFEFRKVDEEVGGLAG